MQSFTLEPDGEDRSTIDLWRSSYCSRYSEMTVRLDKWKLIRERKICPKSILKLDEVP